MLVTFRRVLQNFTHQRCQIAGYFRHLESVVSPVGDAKLFDMFFERYALERLSCTGPNYLFLESVNIVINSARQFIDSLQKMIAIQNQINVFTNGFIARQLDQRREGVCNSVRFGPR